MWKGGWSLKCFSEHENENWDQRVRELKEEDYAKVLLNGVVKMSNVEGRSWC